MPRVRTDGADIFYEETGQGEPLILIPGVGAHARIWGPFPKLFAEKRRVVSYDPRGLGRSTSGERELSVELMGADVKAVLDALKIEKSALLGASMGALVALRFALDYPERATKLVLVTPMAFRSRYGEWLLDIMQLLKENLSPEQYVRALTMLAFAPPFFDKSYGMVREVSRMLTPTAEEFEQIGRQLACLQDADISSEISRIDTPTLIVAGERDALAPIEGARMLASKLRRCRLVSLPGVGHSPFVEATEGVITVVNQFL